MDVATAARLIAALDDVAVTMEAPAEVFPSVEGYTIDRLVGRGGGGAVYRAFHTGSDQAVALKLLSLRIGEGPDAKRAWRELDLLATLRLPAVPRLLDHGMHDGRLFLVTEFIEGRSLLEHCADASLDRRDRVDLLADVADAVQTLHERGIIHRDLKPGNVLVTPDGQPVLVDLGIATSFLEASAMATITEEGMPIGSPAFMASEQARGERALISTRTDVYGLGATAFVVLTGQPPHDLDVTLHEAIRRVAQDEARDPRELEATLPRPLAAVSAKAVSRDPAHRYASAAEFADDLRRWLAGEAVEAGGQSIPQRIGRFVGRHPVAAGTLLILMIAATTVIGTSVGVLWWMNSVPFEVRVDPQKRHTAALLSRSGKELHPWAFGEGQRIVVAEIVDIPGRLGGGRGILLGITGGDMTENEWTLGLLDLDDPDRVIWSVDRTGFDMPSPISNVKGNTFAIHHVHVAEVFPDLAGDEIIAIYQHLPHSAVCIRVQAMDGDVLYQAWHDGHLPATLWVPETRQVIAWGSNSEATWSRRDRQSVGGESYPIVVFAVHPRLGELDVEWIAAPGGRGTMTPDWYRWVDPHPTTRQEDAERISLDLPQLGRDKGAVVRVALRIAGTRGRLASISIYLDEDGVEVDRVPLSTYELYPELPPSDTYELTDDLLPAIGGDGS